MQPTTCVIVADSERARLYYLEQDDARLSSAGARLVETAALISPERRVPARNLFATGRRVLSRSSPRKPVHGVSDGREGHEREVDRRFAVDVTDAALRLCRRHHARRVILIASPAALGMLRGSAERLAHEGHAIRMLSKDLAGLSAPQIHDYLARSGLLPARGRGSA